MFDNLVAATVFTPATPVAAASMRNMSGLALAFPDRVAAGHYTAKTPDILDFQRISIVARAYNAAGNLRSVTVTPTLIAANGGTQFDIYIRDAADALTDDALNVEVSVSKLPLA